MMNIEHKLSKLISVIQEGPMLPGGIRETSSVCGKPNCKCKDKKNPKLHGPYNVLSYSLSEKSSSISLSIKEVPTANEMIERFKKAKSLLNELAIAYSDEARGGNVLEVQCPEISTINSDTSNIKDQVKLRKQSERNEKNRIRIKNLEQSRETWKENYTKKKDELLAVVRESKSNTKQIDQQKREIARLNIELEETKKN